MCANGREREPAGSDRATCAEGNDSEKWVGVTRAHLSVFVSQLFAHDSRRDWRLESRSRPDYQRLPGSECTCVCHASSVCCSSSLKNMYCKPLPASGSGKSPCCRVLVINRGGRSMVASVCGSLPECAGRCLLQVHMPDFTLIILIIYLGTSASTT